MKNTCLFGTIIAVFIALGYLPTPTFAQAAPTIGTITTVPPNTTSVEKYAKFEISFPITTVATNPYYPYDPTPHPTWISSWQNAGLTGISVDMLLLSPGQSNWSNAKILPCFYFQPYEEVGSGIAFLPVGIPEWRCRFSTETKGLWKYKLRATDAGGTFTTPESTANQFNVIEPNLNPNPYTFTHKGYIKVSSNDSRFFEYSDGTPFFYPLVNVEEGDPFISLSNIRTSIPKLGQNGIKFIRWFPTGEGGDVPNPFGDSIKPSWQFGTTWIVHWDQDSVNGNLFSFQPDYFSYQNITAKPGARYRLRVRAKVGIYQGEDKQVLRLKLGNVQMDICGLNNDYHETTTDPATHMLNKCDKRQVNDNDWSEYTLNYTTTSNNFSVWLSALYYNNADPNIPEPYNIVKNGFIIISSATLSREESGTANCETSGSCKWGGNLITRGDPDTYRYIDQNNAIKLDELLRLSEQYGVYHKLTMFHKNDEILHSFLPDGSIGNASNNNFYSGPGQVSRWLQEAYERYFVARWSYSTSLHSLELGNECDLWDESYQAAWRLAKYVHELSPRRILMTNSFWGWWAGGFFTDSTNESDIDYSDKHWYANRTGWGAPGYPSEVISSIWQDTTANIRQCYLRFKEYAGDDSYTKPIVRGETGVAIDGTEPQDPAIAAETTGTYYHKKLWAHVGSLGYTCDGEWYPRLWNYPNPNYFPNDQYDTFKIYKAYETFMSGEPLNNGTHFDIGTDLTTDATGNSQISPTNTDLRAFGSKDPVTSRVLVWVDNKNNTWQSPNWNTSATVIFTIAAGQHPLPNGWYTQETWNTRDPNPNTNHTVTPNAVNVINGALTFTATTAKDIAYKFYNPSIIVPSPTPGVSPTPSPTPLPGDVNGDHSVNAVDLRLILTNFIGSTVCSTFNCDVSGDGKVNLLDAAYVIKYFGQTW